MEIVLRPVPAEDHLATMVSNLHRTHLSQNRQADKGTLRGSEILIPCWSAS
jgi:hypothetical protein